MLALFAIAGLAVLVAPAASIHLSVPPGSRPSHAPLTPLAVRPSSTSLPDFYACTRPDGSDCSDGSGRGLIPPLPVGTTVTMYILPDAISCGNRAVQAEMLWGDGATSNIITGSGRIGPFVHTYNAAGSWDMVGWDSCDGNTDYGPIPISAGVGSIAIAGAGAFIGLLGLGGALASAAPLRGPGSGPRMLRSKEGWMYKEDVTPGGKVFTRLDGQGQPWVGGQHVITKSEPIPPSPPPGTSP